MFKENNKIKIGIFSIVIIFSIIFFLTNSYLINQFRNELNKQVKTIASIYHEKLTNDNVDSQYLLETLLPLINQLDIPMIISTKKTDGTYSYQHLNILITENEGTENYDQIMSTIINRMDRGNAPLTVIEVNNEPVIQIHYGDSILIKNIRWIPYIEFGFAGIVLLLMIIGFNLIQSSERNHVYVGMAKETAHQLGTPISSLMGWVKLLENNSKNKDKIYLSMKRDLMKLENISDKFNKIGSKPKFVNVDIKEILIDVIDYYKSKLPKISKTKIEFLDNSVKPVFVKGDKILLYWAFENLIKNSIDSIKEKKGLIQIIYVVSNNQIEISFVDNGIGIDRKNKNKVFKPGFTTKSKGWGIGLNLSKRIIKDMHKGNLKLIKSKPGDTIFQILLDFSIS